MRRACVACLGAALLLGAAVRAQEQVPPPAPQPLQPLEVVTFDEAVRRAIENNRDVQRATAAITRSEALRRRSRSVWLPNVDVFATETVLDDERGTDPTIFRPRDQFASGAIVSVPIFAPSDWAATRHAADQVEVSALSATDVRRQIARSAALSYLDIIAQRRQLEVDTTARDNAKAQLDFARTRFEGGAGSKLNMLRAASVLSTDEVLIERSAYALRLAQEALGVLLAADHPVDGVEEPAFDVPPAEPVPDLSNRTDVRLFTREVEAAERVLDDTWKDYLPTVDASFSPLYVSPVGAFEEERTWNATIGLRFPIYAGGRRRADRLFRSAELDIARIDLDQTQLEARSEVRIARGAMEAAERGLVHATAAAESSTEVLHITEIAFRAGATTNIELIDAQRQARDDATAAARAADLLRQAKLELLVALGLFPK